MDGYEVFDLILMGTVVVVIIGATACLLLPTFSRTVAVWRTRRWLRRESGRVDQVSIDLIRDSLVADDRVRALGSLIGFGVGVALAPPSSGGEGNTSTVLVWFAGLLAGLWVGRSLRLLLLARSAAPPIGIRVAASRPHRARWYLSRPACGLFIAGVATQIVFGALQIRAVLPWVGGFTSEMVVALAAMVGSVVIIVFTLVVIPWLLSRPMFARNDAELDLQIRLRRDQISGLVYCIYPLAILIQNVAFTIDTSTVPIEVRTRAWTWLPMVAIGLSFVGVMVQVAFSKRWEGRPIADRWPAPSVSLPPRTAGSPPAANAG